MNVQVNDDRMVHIPPPAHFYALSNQ